MAAAYCHPIKRVKLKKNMQLKSFVIPVMNSTLPEEDLNRFLRAHRVLQITRQFCTENGGYWAVLVDYMEGDISAEAAPLNRSNKKDYSKELSEQEYAEFLRLREKRKEVAKKFSLPAYLIFTNEELAILSQQAPLTSEMMGKKIDGVQESHLRDYFSFFISENSDETSRLLDGENHSSGEFA